MEFLTERATIVALAVIGGAFSVAAILARRRGVEHWGKRLDWAGYAFMGVSMFFFIAAGLRGGAA